MVQAVKALTTHLPYSHEALGSSDSETVIIVILNGSLTKAAGKRGFC